MRYARWIGLVACLYSGMAWATIIDFSNLSGNGTQIADNYASRVDASGTDIGGRTGFDTTFGATPNVAVEMYSVDYPAWTPRVAPLSLWETSYSDLYKVAYHASGEGALIRFTADSGYWVRLHEFQMGAWPNTNRILPTLEVLVDGSVVFSQTNITISGATASTFTFDPDVYKGSEIVIRFGNDWNVGIDNIGFSQELIPEPASLLALSVGLAGLVRRRLRRR